MNTSGSDKKEPKPQRSYTPEEQAAALAAVKANGGQVALTAKQLNIPTRTLKSWLTKHSLSSTLLKRSEESLALEFEGIAWQLLGISKKLLKDKKYPSQRIMVDAAIAVDKARLLRNQPTEITQDQGIGDALRDPRAVDLLAELAEINARQRGEPLDVVATPLQDGLQGEFEEVPAPLGIPKERRHTTEPPPTFHTEEYMDRRLEREESIIPTGLDYSTDDPEGGPDGQ